MEGGESGDRLLLDAAKRVGPRLWIEFAWALATGRRRSLARDAQRIVPLLDPPPVVEGLQAVPVRDPFLLVANHFAAPGLWVGWVALAITAAVAGVRDAGRREIHWAITSEWGQVNQDQGWSANPITSAIFPRAAHTWGAIALPADPSQVAGRARALRQLLGYLGYSSRGPGATAEVAGMFPEGRATVALAEAKVGSGALMYRVSRLGVPTLPVGVHARKGGLVISFGEPFNLAELRKDEGLDLDGWARREVMSAIGRLLPRDLWGVYSEDISLKIASEA